MERVADRRFMRGDKDDKGSVGGCPSSLRREDRDISTYRLLKSCCQGMIEKVIDAGSRVRHS